VVFDDLAFDFIPYSPIGAYGQSKTAAALLDGIGGRYFEDCCEALPVRRRPSDFSGGVAPYAIDADNAERLWDLALRAIQ
jgi:hypothetical protein